MSKRVSVVFAVVALAVTVSVTVSGDVYEGGLQCVAGTSTGETPYYTYNRALNDTGGFMNIYCPVTVAEQGDYINGEVYVVDNHCSESITCHLRSHDAVTTSYDYMSSSTSAASCSNSAQLLSYTGGLPASGRFVYVRCYVPGREGTRRSGVHSYRTWIW